MSGILFRTLPMGSHLSATPSASLAGKLWLQSWLNEQLIPGYEGAWDRSQLRARVNSP